MKKITEKEWIKRLNDKFNGQYDYPNFSVPSNGSRGEIKVKCKTHGIFEISLAHHYYRGQGCRSCGYNKSTDKSIDKNFNSIKNFFDERGFFPRVSTWKEINKTVYGHLHNAKGKNYNPFDTAFDYYKNIMETITPNWKWYYNRHVDFYGNVCDSINELVFNNLLYKLGYIQGQDFDFQIPFKDSKRSTDYFFNKINKYVELTGKMYDEKYKKNIHLKIKLRLKEGFDTIILDATPYDINIFYKKIIVPFVKNELGINFKNVPLKDLLVSKKYFDHKQKLIDEYVNKVSIENITSDFLRKNGDMSIQHHIYDVFGSMYKFYENYGKEYDHVNLGEKTYVRKPIGYWTEELIIKKLTEYINSNDDIPSLTCLDRDLSSAITRKGGIKYFLSYIEDKFSDNQKEMYLFRFKKELLDFEYTLNKCRYIVDKYGEFKPHLWLVNNGYSILDNLIITHGGPSVFRKALGLDFKVKRGSYNLENIINLSNEFLKTHGSFTTGLLNKHKPSLLGAIARYCGGMKKYKKMYFKDGLFSN